MSDLRTALERVVEDRPYREATSVLRIAAAVAQRAVLVGLLDEGAVRPPCTR
jgi:hypothetical protein